MLDSQYYCDAKFTAGPQGARPLAIGVQGLVDALIKMRSVFHNSLNVNLILGVVIRNSDTFRKFSKYSKHYSN